jgi:hypothetical protein
MQRPLLSRIARAARRSTISGLTRVELIWIVVCGVAVTAIILGTLRVDMGNAQMRQSQDHLQYLIGQLRFAIEVDPQRGASWPAFMQGPGMTPAGLSEPQGQPIAEVLPTDHYVPIDPWGRAYLMLRNPDGNGWTIGSSGPDGMIDNLALWADAASLPGNLVKLLIVPR